MQKYTTDDTYIKIVSPNPKQTTSHLHNLNLIQCYLFMNITYIRTIENLNIITYNYQVNKTNVIF